MKGLIFGLALIFSVTLVGGYSLAHNDNSKSEKQTIFKAKDLGSDVTFSFDLFTFENPFVISSAGLVPVMNETPKVFQRQVSVSLHRKARDCLRCFDNKVSNL